MKQLIFRIKQNGEIIAETKGMKGKTCMKYIAEMERMANAVTKDSEFSNEYYENDNNLATDTFEEVNE